MKDQQTVNHSQCGIIFACPLHTTQVEYHKRIGLTRYRAAYMVYTAGTTAYLKYSNITARFCGLESTLLALFMKETVHMT